MRANQRAGPSVTYQPQQGASTIGEVHISTSLLATHAEVGGDGLLSVRGGGWEFYSVPRVPSTLQGFLAGLIEFDRDEIGSTHALRLTLADRNGTDLGSSASIMIMAQRRIAPFAVPFTGIVTSPGAFAVTLSDASGPLIVVESEVRVTEPAPD